MSFLEKVSSFLRSILATAVFFSVSSCATVERVYYEHNPSREFSETRNTEGSYIQPFIDQNIIFAVDVKAASRQTYYVWLGLYSVEENRSVYIEKATLAINDVVRTESFLNKNLALDEKLSGSEGMFQNNRSSLKLFVLEEAFLESEPDLKDIELSVYYEIGGRKAIMRFSLKRRVEEYVVYPT